MSPTYPNSSTHITPTTTPNTSQVPINCPLNCHLLKRWPSGASTPAVRWTPTITIWTITTCHFTSMADRTKREMATLNPVITIMQWREAATHSVFDIICSNFQIPFLSIFFNFSGLSTGHQNIFSKVGRQGNRHNVMDGGAGDISSSRDNKVGRSFEGYKLPMSPESEHPSFIASIKYSKWMASVLSGR